MTTSISHRFYSNISWNMFGKAGVLIVSLILSVFITRYLGKEHYGVYASILVVPAFFRLLNSLGFETVLNKSIPEFNVNDPSTRKSRYLLQRMFGLRFASTVLCSIIIYVGLPFYFELISLPHLITFRPTIIFYFAVTSINSLYSTLFMTLLRYKVSALLELGAYLLNLALLVIFIYLNRSILGVFEAYIIATGFNLAVYLFLSTRDFKGEVEKPDITGLGDLAKTSYLASIFCFGLLTQSDLFLMNYFHVSMEKVGFYQLSATIGTMLTFILMGIQPMALSLFSETFTQSSSEGLKKSWSLIVTFSLLFSLPIYIFVFYNAGELLSLVYGEVFTGAEPTLRLFLIFLMVRALTGADFYGITLYAIKKNSMVLRSTVEGSVLNIVINILLIPRYAEFGAMMGTGISVLFIAARRFPLIRKHFPFTNVIKTAFNCILLSTAGLFPIIFISLTWQTNVVLNLACYLITIMGLLYKIKPLHRDQINLIKKQFPFISPWVLPFSR
tara:strand:- start:3402 stop:4904 length:1503 start_codon:yes stop_codon:yes gene_type:complete